MCKGAVSPGAQPYRNHIKAPNVKHVGTVAHSSLEDLPAWVVEGLIVRTWLGRVVALCMVVTSFTQYSVGQALLLPCPLTVSPSLHPATHHSMCPALDYTGAPEPSAANFGPLCNGTPSECQLPKSSACARPVPKQRPKHKHCMACSCMTPQGH